MSFLKSLALAILGFCVGCSAQAPSPQSAPSKMQDAQLSDRIVKQVRAHFNIPEQVAITVSTPKPSDVAGFDTVVITMSDGQKGKNYEFLLSKDGKTLARMTRIDLTKDPYQEAMSKIDTNGRPVRGNKDAKVTIVNYDDFECPFCARMHTVINSVLRDYGDKVRVIYKDFPLSEIHPWAERAANDSNCLAAQNNDAYWDFADYVHANQSAITGKAEKRTAPAMTEAVDKLTIDIGRKHSLNVDQLQACVNNQSESSSLKKSVQEATALDVSATPTVFVNGERFEGALEEQALVDVIKKHMQDQPASAGPAK